MTQGEPRETRAPKLAIVEEILAELDRAEKLHPLLGNIFFRKTEIHRQLVHLDKAVFNVTGWINHGQPIPDEDLAACRKQAVQVAAMAIRFILILP